MDDLPTPRLRLDVTPSEPIAFSRDAPTGGLQLGEVAPDFDALPSVDGVPRSLAAFPDAHVLVLAFLGDACPAVKAGIGELVRLQRHFREAGLQVVAVNSNNPFLSPADTMQAMQTWAHLNELNFPYLKDEHGTLARSYGARNTPH